MIPQVPISFPYLSNIGMKSTQSFDFAIKTSNMLFKEVAPYGINNVRKKFNITWENLSKDVKILLDEQLTAGGTWQIYLFKFCYETDFTKVRMDKDSLTFQVIGNNVFTATASFVEVFDRY